jgi:hypothetical protein
MNEEKIAVEQYVCSLIDILGQKEKLAEIKGIDFKHNVDKVKEVLKKTYGAVAHFRHNMNDSMKFMNLIKLDHGIKTNFTSNPIEIKSFSDLISSYVSLRDDKNKLQFEGIFFLLFSNCEVFLKMLAKGIPLRGGIDIGIGLKIEKDELYGTALSNPYILESKVAKSIRVVIGQELYEHIDNCAKSKVESNESLDYNIEYAKLCKKIIIQDSDGEYILDYLSSEIHGMENFEEISKKAKDFLEKTQNELQIKHEFEVAKKYREAIKYFERNGI